MKRFFIGIFLFLLFACVSRSLLNERYNQSTALSVPSLSISLSDNNRFSFAFVGDLHIGGRDTTRLQTILNQAASEGDSFIILLGDIVDKGDTEDVEAVKSAIASSAFNGKTLYVIGNHDIFNNGWDSYKEQLGRSFYTVDIGNSRFIALDTADGNVGKDQSEWFLGELKKSKPTHTFVLSHYLPYIPLQRTYLKLADEEEAFRLMKWVSSNGVTAWLGAHYHSYLVSEVEKVRYVVAGGAGGRRMEPVKNFFFAQAIVNGQDVTFSMKAVD